MVKKKISIFKDLHLMMKIIAFTSAYSVLNMMIQNASGIPWVFKGFCNSFFLNYSYFFTKCTSLHEHTYCVLSQKNLKFYNDFLLPYLGELVTLLININFWYFSISKNWFHFHKGRYDFRFADNSL